MGLNGDESKPASTRCERDSGGRIWLCQSDRRTKLTKYGEMAERSKATVLKTVVPQGTQGSNPCLSANFHKVTFIFKLSHMIPLEFIRQFRLGGYAIFDFAAAFLGIYLLSPLLSKVFRKLRLDIPRHNWLFLTLPMSILVHLLVGNITPMTGDFIDIHDNYILKILILVLLFFGIRGIKIIRKSKNH